MNSFRQTQPFSKEYANSNHQESPSTSPFPSSPNVYQHLLDESYEMVILLESTDTGPRICYVNRKFVDKTGYTSSKILGEPLTMLAGENTQAELLTQSESIDDWQQTFDDSIYNVDNRELNVHIRTTRFGDSEQGPYFGLFLLPRSAPNPMDETISRQAHYDSLTNLPNRKFFMERLEQALALARRNQNQLAVVFLDLDNFKQINDTLGHDVGDGVLVEVSERFRSLLRESDTVGRIGGDEFALLLTNIQDKNSVRTVLRNIFGVLRQPIEVEENKLSVQVSMGVALFPKHAEKSTELIQKADAAMYRAKEQGKNAYQLYREGLEISNTVDRSLKSDIEQAIRENQFKLVYLPEVSKNGQIQGLEALLRWEHPQRGLLKPDDFMALAEMNGQIIPISQWVRRELLKHVTSVPNKLDGVSWSMNISAQEFRQVDFVDSLVDDVYDFELNPDKFRLEFEEPMVMQDVSYSENVFEELNEAGFPVALDDVGTGESSIKHLRNFTFDVMKISEELIPHTPSQSREKGLIKNLIELSQDLNVTCIAEGVESRRQKEWLTSRGTQHFQGRYFYKPHTFNEIQRRIH